MKRKDQNSKDEGKVPFFRFIFCLRGAQVHPPGAPQDTTSHLRTPRTQPIPHNHRAPYTPTSSALASCVESRVRA